MISVVLDQDDAIDTDCFGRLDQFLGRETRRVQVVDRLAGSERKSLDVSCPDMGMRVYPTPWSRRSRCRGRRAGG